MERGYVLTTTTKALYCLPQITSNILNGFIGGHITRFFVQDLCKYSSMGTTCLTTRRYGTLSSIIGSLGLFLDLFISSFVDASSRKHQKGHAIPLIATTAPIACLINITLFNVQYLQSFIQNVALLVHLKASPMLTLSCLFIILSVVKNITPLALAYHSLGPALTRNCSQNDRNSLFAYKHVFGLLGNMLGGFLPSIAIYLLGNENEVYWQSVYVTLASIVDLLAYWLLCLHLRNHINSITSPEMHREEPAVSKNEYNIIPNMKQAFSNRAFKVILLLFIYEASRGILWGGLFPFYLSQVIGLDNVQYEFWSGILSIIGMVLALMATPIWHYLSSKLGNYRAWLLSYSLQVPVGLFLYISIDIGAQQVYRYLFFFIILSITGSASGFLLDSIKANAIDYEELRTMERREASFEACWSLFPRYISLFSNAFSFGIVSYYNSPEFENKGQYSLQARRTIAILTSLLPSLTSFICLYIMYLFPINDTMHLEILESIKKLKNGQEVRDPITFEKIKPVIRSTSHQAFTSAQNFFNFELRWYVNSLQTKNQLYAKWQSTIEYILFIFWICISILCGYMFIKDISSENDKHDLRATIYLWFSSISFTIAFGFHYARITVMSSDFAPSKLSHSFLSEYLSATASGKTKIE